MEVGDLIRHRCNGKLAVVMRVPTPERPYDTETCIMWCDTCELLDKKFTYPQLLAVFEEVPRHEGG